MLLILLSSWIRQDIVNSIILNLHNTQNVLTEQFVYNEDTTTTNKTSCNLRHPCHYLSTTPDTCVCMYLMYGPEVV